MRVARIHRADIGVLLDADGGTASAPASPITCLIAVAPVAIAARRARRQCRTDTSVGAVALTRSDAGIVRIAGDTKGEWRVLAHSVDIAVSLAAGARLAARGPLDEGRDNADALPVADSVGSAVPPTCAGRARYVRFCDASTLRIARPPTSADLPAARGTG